MFNYDQKINPIYCFAIAAAALCIRQSKNKWAERQKQNAKQHYFAIRCFELNAAVLSLISPHSMGFKILFPFNF